MVKDYSMLIDGEWRESSDGGAFASSTRSRADVGASARATTADVDAAVAAAGRAFTEGPWAASTPLKRAAPCCAGWAS